MLSCPSDLRLKTQIDPRRKRKREKKKKKNLEIV